MYGNRRHISRLLSPGAHQLLLFPSSTPALDPVHPCETAAAGIGQSQHQAQQSSPKGYAADAVRGRAVRQGCERRPNGRLGLALERWKTGPFSLLFFSDPDMNWPEVGRIRMQDVLLLRGASSPEDMVGYVGICRRLHLSSLLKTSSRARRHGRSHIRVDYTVHILS